VKTYRKVYGGLLYPKTVLRFSLRLVRGRFIREGVRGASLNGELRGRIPDWGEFTICFLFASPGVFVYGREERTGGRFGLLSRQIIVRNLPRIYPEALGGLLEIYVENVKIL